MPPRLELEGRRFGKLVVLARSHKDPHHAWIWSCRCDCGTDVTVRGSTLVARRTSACHSCAATIRATTHGQSNTPLYWRWRAMLDRTGRSGYKHYQNYGGRGITVCDRWLTFENFAADMGVNFRPGLTIERVDNNGPYSPENCRWATHAEQQHNKRNNHVVTWSGQSMTVTEWALALGIKPNTLIYRLRRGWPVERALTTEVANS